MATYVLGDQRITIERVKLHGVNVVHEVTEWLKGHRQPRREEYTIDPVDLMSVRPCKRAPFQAACTSLEAIDQLAKRFSKEHLPNLITGHQPWTRYART